MTRIDGRAPLRSVSLVLFDFDGLLADTYPVRRAASLTGEHRSVS